MDVSVTDHLLCPGMTSMTVMEAPMLLCWRACKLLKGEAVVDVAWH